MNVIDFNERRKKFKKAGRDSAKVERPVLFYALDREKLPVREQPSNSPVVTIPYDGSEQYLSERLLG